MLNDFKIIEEKEIIKINMDLGCGGILKDKSVAGCYSSIYYFDDCKSAVSSVFRSLCKNHYFLDGNKRTACACLYILCKINNIYFNIPDNLLSSIAIDVSEHNYEINHLCELLFNK